MHLYEIIVLVALVITLLCFIVWYYQFKHFLKRNENKTVDELNLKIKRYLYLFYRIVIVGFILTIIRLILSFALS